MTTYITNLRNRASGELASHDYTEYCNFNEMQLAISASGLHRVCNGDADDLVTINAYFTIAPENFESSNLKRLRTVYLSYDSDGDIILSLTPDEKERRKYTVDVQKNGHKKVRRRVGIRPRGEYWELMIENVNGCDLRVDVVELLVMEMNQGFK